MHNIMQEELPIIAGEHISDVVSSTWTNIHLYVKRLTYRAMFSR